MKPIFSQPWLHVPCSFHHIGPLNWTLQEGDTCEGFSLPDNFSSLLTPPFMKGVFSPFCVTDATMAAFISPSNLPEKSAMWARHFFWNTFILSSLTSWCLVSWAKTIKERWFGVCAIFVNVSVHFLHCLCAHLAYLTARRTGKETSFKSVM